MAFLSHHTELLPIKRKRRREKGEGAKKKKKKNGKENKKRETDRKFPNTMLHLWSSLKSW